jgi:diguanylate cyclase
VGFLAGCLVCQSRTRSPQRSTPESGDASAPTENVDPQRGLLLLRHAETAFRSFCALTDDLHHDVGEHKERLAAATTSLDNAMHTKSDVQGAVTRIVEANAWLQDQLVEAQKTIRKQSAELEERILEANTDGLTGIANRRAFDLELNQQLARWHRFGQQFALALVDIDHFKRVNDAHGHVAGDEVLRAVADMVRGNVREVDFVARYGGEEFAIILRETDHEGALIVADRLRKFIASAQIPWQEQMLAVTVSVGIAGLSRLDDAASITQRADEALYISKHAGRNRTTLASPPAPQHQAVAEGAPSGSN